jgi:DNA-binding transcriptional ArsR family regulator
VAQTSTDADVIKALSHPVRRQVMTLLGDESASSKDLAAQLGLSVPNVSYHVRILRDLGLIKVVRETPRRGAIERHYKVTSRAISVRQVIDWLLIADQRRPKGWSAKAAHLDAEGLQAVAAAFDKMWREVDKAEAQANRRTTRAGSIATRHVIGTLVAPVDDSN